MKPPEQNFTRFKILLSYWFDIQIWFHFYALMWEEKNRLLKLSSPNQNQKFNETKIQNLQDDGGDSAEVKIAKVAITNVMLWVGIWSPYAIVCMICCFGDRSLVSPLVSQLPSFFAKIASCLNPVVFAVSHPKYREALAVKCACMGIGDKPKDDNQTAMQTMKE